MSSKPALKKLDPQPAKRRVGRPATKYKPEFIIPKLISIAEELDQNPDRYFDYGIVQSIAGVFATTVDVIYGWKKAHPEFAKALKKWEEARDRALIKLSRYDKSRKMHPAVWIFSAKNILGWRDRQEVESSGTQTIKVISAIPRPDPRNKAYETNTPALISASEPPVEAHAGEKAVEKAVELDGRK